MNAAPAGHPSPEEVDALLDDSSGSTGARVGAHVAGCERCQSLAEGMRQVRAALRAEGASPPVMPPEVQARLDAALADAVAARSGAGSGSRTIVPLDRRREGAGRRGRPSGSEPAGQGPGVPRWLTVAAGLAVLGGAATASTQLFDAGGQDEASTAGGAVQDSGADGGAAEAAGGFDGVTTSGTAYRADALPGQVQALLAGGDAAPDAGGQPGALTAAETPLQDPQTLDRCLEALGAGGQVPLAVDAGTWQGQAASVVVLPDDARPGTVQVWVVGPACGDPDDDLLHYQVVQS